MLSKLTSLAACFLGAIVLATSSVQGAAVSAATATTKRAGQDVVIYFRDGVKAGNEQSCNVNTQNGVPVGIGSALGGASDKWWVEWGRLLAC